MHDAESKPPTRPNPASTTGHERHCFIVMPYGRDASEQKWFRGWYEVVIKAAVIEAGYEPKLSASEDQPTAINDEIRAHLALDPMIVVDLGGAEPEEDPNPNVMYELGIRHAFGLPLVMMACKGQPLPFDVSNQRIIIEERDLVDLETNKRRLIAFIQAAESGKYYKPMDAVGRTALIVAASESLGEESLLRALAQEVRDMRTSLVKSPKGPQPSVQPASPRTAKKILSKKVFRKDIYPYFLSLTGDGPAWTQIMNTPLTEGQAPEMQAWGAGEWKAYLVRRLGELRRSPPINDSESLTPTADTIAAVKDLLPARPWPSGLHKDIADKLSLTAEQVSRCIAELVRRGNFMQETHGKLLPAGGLAEHSLGTPQELGDNVSLLPTPPAIQT